jgi:hypothetical protein
MYVYFRKVFPRHTCFMARPDLLVRIELRRAETHNLGGRHEIISQALFSQKYFHLEIL